MNLDEDEKVGVAYRDKHWWEKYPLHKLWCNDQFPLVPRFTYRPADKYNSWDAGVHWLCINIWTMSRFSFGVDAELSFTGIGVGFILPYLRVWIGFRHFYSQTLYKIERFFSRDPEPIHYGD